MHYAQAFQDSVHFFGNDAGSRARAIPPHQPEVSSQQRMPSSSSLHVEQPLPSQIPESQVSNQQEDAEGRTQQELFGQEIQEPPATQRKAKRSRREAEEEDEAQPTQRKSRKRSGEIVTTSSPTI